MKIYTKKGDQGYTALLGGVKVSKHHIRIEAYGTVDELNSYTGMVRDVVVDPEIRNLLGTVQHHLFSMGSLLAAQKGAAEKMQLPTVTLADTEALEVAIDKMDKALPELKSFILPGGDPAVSWCHIARSVCRRAERTIVALNDVESIDTQIITYINRLSDFFFILARKQAADLGKDEVQWRP